jgi:hypothetical protein
MKTIILGFVVSADELTIETKNKVTKIEVALINCFFVIINSQWIKVLNKFCSPNGKPEG